MTQPRAPRRRRAEHDHRRLAELHAEIDRRLDAFRRQQEVQATAGSELPPPPGR